MSDRLIIALDVDSLHEAGRLVRLFREKVSLYKVGLNLFTSAGPDVVRMIQDEGCRVFLDLKFHDIPNTVAQACEAAARLHVFMMNVHARGGDQMMKAAAKAVGDRSIVLGVTVLTSDSKTADTEAEVVRLARSAQGAGLGGVVCSPWEARAVREACGKDFVIVTPGIRPKSKRTEVPSGSERAIKETNRWGARGESGLSPRSDDQKRVMTPSKAVEAGSDYLVIGRPVLEADNPIQALESILQDLS